jgi:hypothetical protein
VVSHHQRRVYRDRTVVVKIFDESIKLLNLATKEWSDLTIEPGWEDFTSIAWTGDGECRRR